MTEPLVLTLPQTNLIRHPPPFRTMLASISTTLVREIYSDIKRSQTRRRVDAEHLDLLIVSVRIFRLPNCSCSVVDLILQALAHRTRSACEVADIMITGEVRGPLAIAKSRLLAISIVRYVFICTDRLLSVTD